MAEAGERPRRHLSKGIEAMPSEARPLSPAEFAAYRHMIGLSARELAERLDVRVTTVQDWESGRRGARPSSRISDEVRALVAEHAALAQAMAMDGQPVVIPRSSPDRGWLLAAAARALEIEPDIMLEWLDS